MSAPETSPAAQSPASGRRVRWWPLLVIVTLAAGALILIWANADLQRQNKHLGTFVVAMLTGLASWVWFAFLSRLPGKLRLWGGVLIFILAAASAGLFAAFYQIRGFTGDFLPIIEPRSKPRDSEQIVQATTLPTTAANVESEMTRSTPHDFPQFLGPTRNCVITGVRLATDWTAQPPVEVWRRPMGPAWSGFAIVGRMTVTQEQRGSKEVVVAYDLQTGQPLWSHEDEAHYVTPIAGEGPRATPTISEGRVFTHGARGHLNCLELETGRLVWSARTVAGDRDVPQWGVSSSPLLVSNLVVVNASGKQCLAAFERNTGAQAWTAGSDSASYSSPFLAHVAGRDQILSFNNASISAHDPASGDTFWSHAWKKEHPKVALPVVLPDDRLHFSSGYGVGSQLFQVKANPSGGLKVESLWKTIKMKAKFTNLIHKDGYIYGLDDGIMACQDVATGELKWKDGRYGHGQILFDGETILVMCETGDVVLMQPSPGGLLELGKFTAFTEKTWNPPALSGDLLLIRNHKEAACYRLPMVK